ncbi:hypothetical protein AC1031_010200 [Aphanomyces cochlioides]|nr:hypothetical protein AC1031_010200 [Aphanomyces cochlioides]
MRSGTSPEEIISTACRVYNERYPRPFELLHCWTILQTCSKFTTPPDPKRMLGDDAAASDKTSNEHRGQKKAKFAQQSRDLHAREVKRLDRIAKALEDKNNIMRYRMMLRYCAADERGDIVAAIKKALERSSLPHNDTSSSDEDHATYNESTLV